MKICIVGEHRKPLWAGSATRNVLDNLSKSLTQKQIETYVFEITTEKGKIKKIYFKLDFKSSENVCYVTGGIINLIFYLNKKKIKLVHMNVLRTYMAPLILFLKIFRIKIITTLHDTFFLSDEIKTKDTHIKYFLMKGSDALFVLNNKDKNYVAKRFYKPIYVVKEGVDRKLNDLKIDLSNTDKVILFPNGIGKTIKGLDFLQEALKDSNYRKNLKIFGVNHSKNNHPNYFGELSKEDFYNELLKTRICVISSSYESFSLSALEALSVGLPTIVTNKSGITDYLQDGRGCFIVEYGNTKQLFESIEKLMVDDILWKKMSDEAKQVSKQFYWDKIVDDYIECYNSLLKSNNYSSFNYNF